MNLALLGLANLFSEGNQAAATYTLVGVAFAQFVGLVLFKVFAIFKLTEKVTVCLRRGQPAEDDWEDYERTALERVMECDEENRDSYGTFVSRPTY